MLHRRGIKDGEPDLTPPDELRGRLQRYAVWRRLRRRDGGSALTEHRRLIPCLRPAACERLRRYRWRLADRGERSPLSPARTRCSFGQATPVGNLAHSPGGLVGLAGTVLDLQVVGAASVRSPARWTCPPARSALRPSLPDPGSRRLKGEIPALFVLRPSGFRHGEPTAAPSTGDACSKARTGA